MPKPFKPDPKPKKTIKNPMRNSFYWSDLKNKSAKKSLANKKPLLEKDNEFLFDLWTKREHKCFDCGISLGGEYSKAHMHHILYKSRFPALRYEPLNIVTLCLQCHDNIHRGFITPKIKELTDNTKILFDIV